MERVSVVIAAHNEGRNLADMVGCLLAHSDHPRFEIVIVDDGSSDGCGRRVARRFGGEPAVSVLHTPHRGVPAARNLGARRARGSLLVFFDGHCYVPPGWLTPLVEAAGAPGVGMAGPAIGDLNRGNGPLGHGATWSGPSLEMEWLPQTAAGPYRVPLVPGGCQAMPRPVFEEVGGYDEGIIRWGSEDLELSLRVWLMGYANVVQPRSKIYHFFRTGTPFAVDGVEFLHNRLRLAAAHLSGERLERVLGHYRQSAGFERSLALLFDSDIADRRRRLHAVRRRDDAAFCERFDCPV